ncbi:MAG: glutamate--tRNA ligase [Acholeplasmatales bacterium]|nr:glutamate--tRNA ligase [Acholeplasmatales bacterium]
MNEVRVRYAPSPTGLLHIGNARTAIFNYLYARHHQGSFIIRIEDTDVKRNVRGGEESQLTFLKWLGLDFDEGDGIGGEYGPYHQLQRLDIYQYWANQLLQLGWAYKEYKDPLDQSCFAIRFKVPENQILAWDDLVRGHIQYDSKEVEDWIMMKDNGIPTYNFAVVIDDHLMKISHILRGEEHITNTPKQIMVYHALGWEVPSFGHMTIIVNEKGKKLSKRDADVEQFISQYYEKGYLPSALFNFISLLGWSSPNNKEILSKEEIIQLFDSKRLTSSPSFFDKNKLNFLNAKHLKALSIEQLEDFLRPFLAQAKIKVSNNKYKKLVLIFKDRLVYGQQIVQLYNEFVNKKFILTPELIQECQIYEQAVAVIEYFLDRVVKLKKVESPLIDELILATQKELNVSGKALYVPLRIATTAEGHGPSLGVILELLGKQKVVKHLTMTLQTLKRLK